MVLFVQVFQWYIDSKIIVYTNLRAGEVYPQYSIAL